MLVAGALFVASIGLGFGLELARVETLPFVDLELTKSVDSDEVEIGDTLTYTISLTNATGTSDATNVCE